MEGPVHQLEAYLRDAVLEVCESRALYARSLRVQGTICVTSDLQSGGVVVAHITESLVMAGQRKRCKSDANQTEVTLHTQQDLPNKYLDAKAPAAAPHTKPDLSNKSVDTNTPTAALHTEQDLINESADSENPGDSVGIQDGSELYEHPNLLDQESLTDCHDAEKEATGHGSHCRRNSTSLISDRVNPDSKSVEPTSGHRWANVGPAGPALDQRWADDTLLSGKGQVQKTEAIKIEPEGELNDCYEDVDTSEAGEKSIWPNVPGDIGDQPFPVEIYPTAPTSDTPTETNFGDEQDNANTECILLDSDDEGDSKEHVRKIIQQRSFDKNHDRVVKRARTLSGHSSSTETPQSLGGIPLGNVLPVIPGHMIRQRQYPPQSIPHAEVSPSSIEEAQSQLRLQGSLFCRLLSGSYSQFSAEEMLVPAKSRCKRTAAQTYFNEVLRLSASSVGIWEHGHKVKDISADQQRAFFEEMERQCPCLAQYRSSVWVRLTQALGNRRQYLLTLAKGKSGPPTKRQRMSNESEAATLPYRVMPPNPFPMIRSLRTTSHDLEPLPHDTESMSCDSDSIPCVALPSETIASLTENPPVGVLGISECSASQPSEQQWSPDRNTEASTVDDTKNVPDGND